MRNKLKKTNSLYCFSPPVMIATFVIEVLFAAHIAWRYKKSRAVQITIALLLCLAIFQLAEYAVCEFTGSGPTNWARLGFSAITLLPPLGLHLAYAIARKKVGLLVPLAYVFAAGWVGIFVFGSIMKGQGCYGNYVIFEITDPAEGLYYLYYNTVTALSIIQAWLLARTQRSKKIRRALYWLIIGYMTFIVPSVMVRLMFEFNEEVSSSALPSIMCGFAVLLALTLYLKVVPLVGRPARDARKSAHKA